MIIFTSRSAELKLFGVHVFKPGHDIQSNFKMNKPMQILKNNQLNIRNEILGGVVTFLSMSYIIIVNPSILIQAIPGVENTGMTDAYMGAFMVATIVGSFVATLIMGVWAKYPIALAPGMGLNAFFVYSVCIGMGIDWTVALAAIFIEGIIFIIFTLSGLREFIVKAIPATIKNSMIIGIGLFIAFIGFKNCWYLFHINFPFPS